VLALLVAFVLKMFVAQAFYIPSESMEPQLEVGDRVVVSKLAYHLHDPRRGDIAVFDSPEDTGGDTSALPARVLHDVLGAVGLRQPPEEELIKRVIGLPGDTVEGRDGHVFVNDRELIEPYLSPGTVTSDFPRELVPPRHLWMMGDNRGNSMDSRVFGPVSIGSVVGRALVRLWPPGRTAFL
jgi:signal peptidase I